MHLNIFPKPYHNAYPFDPKYGTHPLLFHGVRSFTGADRPKHTIDASVCLRFSKSRVRALSPYGQGKQEQVVKR